MPAGAPPEIVTMLRDDLLPTSIGLLICGLGLAAGTLALLRRRIEPTLASFAGLALLYGIRLLADTDTVSLLFPGSRDALERGINVITYLIPVPAFLFFQKLVGRGWRSLLWRLWQLQVALAFVAVPLELLAPRPGILLELYRVLVLVGMAAMLAHLFWPGWLQIRDRQALRVLFLILALFVTLENLGNLGLFQDLNIEPLGFLIFLFGLGILAARRALEDQESLSSIRQELETARRIQEATLPQSTPRIAGLDVAARYVPAASAAGTPWPETSATNTPSRRPSPGRKS